MNAIELHDPPAVERVGITELVCPGCAGPVAGVPPVGWPDRAGVAPGFSHPDGSVLCPDRWGRVPDPVEAACLRFGLTEAGASVALDEARGWAR